MNSEVLKDSEMSDDELYAVTAAGTITVGGVTMSTEVIKTCPKDPPPPPVKLTPVAYA
jgi:hypothetical protein